MHDIETGLQDLAEIRSMMERASKFLTLSGLSGIGAGVIALAGAWAAWIMLGSNAVATGSLPQQLPAGLTLRLIGLGASVLILALGTALLFSSRMASRQGRQLWGPATRLLLGALAVPFVAGGSLSLILLYQGHLWLVPGMLLLFYGIGLFAAGSFTFGEIRYLGIAQALLGLAAVFSPDLGLILWAAGFGVLHIVYGAFLYFRYES
jgi:hypothetical protein